MNHSGNDRTHTKYFKKQYYASLEKYKSLSYIASAVGFVAPEIVDFNNESRSITFKYIHNLHSLRVSYIQHMSYSSEYDNSDLFYSVGRVLAGIHKKLELTYTEPWAPCKTFDNIMLKKFGFHYEKVLSDTPQANIHCDFGFSNVNYQEINGLKKLVILDPCPNDFVTFHACTYTSVYIDIANFSACLDGLIPVNYYLKIDWRKIVVLKEAFLSGYEENSDLHIDRHLLACMSFAIVHSYFNNRYRNQVKTWATRTLVYNPVKQYLSKDHKLAKISV